MTQLTDEQYWELSDSVYQNKHLEISSIETLSNKKLKEIQTVVSKDGSEWVTINSINHESGLQAMAVVSLDEYKALCSRKIKSPENMVFVTRGSESNKDAHNDWVTTNMGNLGVGMRPETIKKINPDEYDGHTHEEAMRGHQFIQYDAFVRQTVKQFNPEKYSFTGHSLGGALAQYMAVIMDTEATTFAAARAYRLLPAELQKAVREGKYDDMIRDYRHKNDPVGYLPLGEVIGSRYMTKSAKSDFPLFAGPHLQDSFHGMFNGDGSIQSRISPEEILEQLPLFDSAIDSLRSSQETVEGVTDNIDRDIKTVYRHYESQMGVGSFSHVTVSDLEDIFDEFAQSFSGDNYYFYDRKLKKKIPEGLEQRKKEIAHFRDSIGEGAMLYDKRDRELAAKLNHLFGDNLK